MKCLDIQKLYSNVAHSRKLARLLRNADNFVSNRVAGRLLSAAGHRPKVPQLHFSFVTGRLYNKGGV